MSVFGVHGGDASALTDVAAAPRDYNPIRMSEILTSSAKSSTLALLYPEVPLASAVQGGSCGFVLDFDCALPASRWPFRSGRTTLSILTSDIGAYRQD